MNIVFNHLSSLLPSGWRQCAHCLTSGAQPGVCCDVLAPWNSTASDPLPPAVHTTVPWPNSHGILYGFPPKERAWGDHSAPLHRAVLIPHPESSPRFQHCGLAHSALGSQGNPRQKTKTLASNSRAPCSKVAPFPCLLLCVVFKIPFFLSLWFN